MANCAFVTNVRDDDMAFAFDMACAWKIEMDWRRKAGYARTMIDRKGINNRNSETDIDGPGRFRGVLVRSACCLFK